MGFLEILKTRRSVRSYTKDTIPDDKIEKILQAGLLSPSSRANHPCEFIVVRKKETLQYLAECRDGGHAKMLAGADCAIIVIADSQKSDVWTEDSSIAMLNMHLMANSLEVGSCWIQGRLRSVNGESTENYLRAKLNFPETHKLEAILSLGMHSTSPKPHDIENLAWEKVHKEIY